MSAKGSHKDSHLALVGGTLIDGSGQDPVPDAVVVVNGPIIEAFGSKDNVEIPDGCSVIEITGKTIMPGMIDCHCHVGLSTLNIEKRLFTHKTVEIFQTAENMKRTLHAGFTTIREPMLQDVGFRHAVEMGLIEGPRLILAGAMGQTGGHFDEFYPRGIEVPLLGPVICDGVPDVQKAARQLLRQDFDFIKICTTGGVASPADAPEYTEWSFDELKAIVDEAKARGKAVMAHAEGNQGIKNAIRAGVWSVEHGSILDDEAIQMLLDTGTYLVPTLFVVYEEIEHMDRLGLSPLAMEKARMISEVSLESFEKAVAARVKIAVGTDVYDAGMHGRNARELELMVRHGFTPMQAIMAATKTAAETCRVADKVGTLETGKLADLLVVDGNPLRDISILQDASRLQMVMKEGISHINTLGQR